MQNFIYFGNYLSSMLKNLLRVLFVIMAVAIVFSFKYRDMARYSKYLKEKQVNIAELSVEEVLIQLGDPKPIHYIPEVNLDSAKMGEEMIKYGRLSDKSNKLISKYFVCTDCHNLVQETEDPADDSPEAQLEFGKKNKLPFLQGATFYGMYNKRHWYNGDYDKKYGELVNNTRDSLHNAIQLCATQCSQGREMTFWEIRCVLHYYKSLEYIMGDLVFTNYEIELLRKSLIQNPVLAREIIHSRYIEATPETFGTSKLPEIEGYQPNMENGEYIYVYGCLHCHSPEKNITNFDLKMDNLSFKFLDDKLYKYNHFSISHITRYGTYAISGRKQYMPQYTMENMSDEQLLDLIAYVKMKANE